MINVNNLEFKKFPGGELHLTNKWYNDFYLELNPIDRKDDVDNVICRIQNSDDFMKLCLFTDAFKRLWKLNNLIIPYIPYARQDRIPVTGEALSIKVFTDLLNNLGYSKVTVLDPHSDVSTALINNVNIIPQCSIWSNQLIWLYNNNFITDFDLISPDAGALKKIYKLHEYVKEKCKNIRIGMKHRDVLTGQITGTSIIGEAEAKTCIIVDDICDGGRTFIELAKVIRKDYDKLILCITHGIFSNGFDELFKYFDQIYTTNSWNPNLESKDKLHVIPVESILA